MLMADGIRRILAVSGLVQGVGFRPFVYRLATPATCSRRGAQRHPRRDDLPRGPARRSRTCSAASCRNGLPELARIDACATIEEHAIADWSTRFEIRHSEAVDARGAHILPDAHVCTACRDELFDPADRRHPLPADQLHQLRPALQHHPRDSPTTGRRPRWPRSRCARAVSGEYDSPDDRRSTPSPTRAGCAGPKVTAARPRRPVADYRRRPGCAPPRRCSSHGKVLAVKALGGYQIMADPGNLASVAALRARKERSAKPFALARPRRRRGRPPRRARRPRAPAARVARPADRAGPGPARQRAVARRVAPGSPTLGFMLPATPLQHPPARRRARTS